MRGQEFSHKTTRRHVLKLAAAAGLCDVSWRTSVHSGATAQASENPSTTRPGQTPPLQIELPEADIVEACRRAATQNVLAAVNPKVFFGYWSVCADGKDFGYGNTYPSLDGHQMADALLWLGQLDVVKANWSYVRSFQRPDGQLPIAILPGMKEVSGTPVDANGGFYRHWVPGDPLRALGGTTYVQNADVIYRYTLDRRWLECELPSINLAADFLASLTTPEGMVAGAGYYVERPTRVEYDGVAQCHAVDAFRRTAALNQVAGDRAAVQKYQGLADRIASCFRSRFWAKDHCVEYIHPQRGAIDRHGLTDVDWSALATDVATPDQKAILWPRLKDENRFYYGGMPTGIATHPEAYERWEFTHPDRQDLAAMGRAWYLDAWARWRMRDAEGLLDGLRRVCKAGRDAGYYWRERYGTDDKGRLRPFGANKYCEYPANLIRIMQRFVFGVDLRLDSAVSLCPVVPQTFWDAGFGQTLSWRGQCLTYRMKRNEISGDFQGNSAQRLYVRFPSQVNTAQFRCVLGGRAADVQRNGDDLVIDLPADKSGVHFEIR